MLEGGVKKVLGIARGGVKKFSRTKIEIFQPPHQGIYERSLRLKKSIGWAKYVYVCVWDMCWRNVCNISLLTRKCEKLVKNSPFSNERHFEIWIPKKRITTFFWSKLSKLHKKDPKLHVATTFSLKQEKTRTSHGPIPHPLRATVRFKTVSKQSFRDCHSL